MADTRKDKRAPISLKVRFKSATLDEFIEQYSVDISRGGIFIKSKTPMSIGTLLKFEFRRKDESRLIHGVGRVVWKREEDGSGKPPGMGIKFIKMDPESRGLVEQMVSKRGDAPGRFEEGQEPEEAPAAAPFFPSTTPESELPAPEDRTQVRHASEFLASALSEGGSESASKEAEKKAEEARKRTEEIEKKRAEAKRKPRIKKTLVGVGVPDETAGDAPSVEAEPIAVAKPVEPVEEPKTEPEEKVEATPEPKSALDVSESAETTALDRAALGLDADEPEAAAKADAAEPEPEKAEAKEPEKVEAKAPEKEEPEEPVAKAPEKKAEAKAPEKKPEPEKKAEPKKAEAKAPEKRSEPPKPKPVARPEPPPPQEEPRSRMGMILFGLVAVLALGYVAYTQLVPKDNPPEPTQDIASEPQNDDAVPEEELGAEEQPTEEQGADDQGTEDLAVQEEQEPEAPPVPTVAVQVVTTPAGATVSVGGAEQGAAPLEVQLPIGQAATVTAHLAGYTDASQEVTAQEGQHPLRLTLTQMAYAIHVETTPPGALVRGPGNATAPGDIALRRPPTGALSLTASLRGYNNATHEVQPSDFVESEGRMVANVTMTLEERPQPVRREPTERPQQQQAAHPEGGEAPAGGGGEEAHPAEQPVGDTGGTSGRQGRRQQPAAGGGETGASEPAEAPAGGGGGGGGAEAPEPPPPDNPF